MLEIFINKLVNIIFFYLRTIIDFQFTFFANNFKLFINNILTNFLELVNYQMIFHLFQYKASIRFFSFFLQFLLPTYALFRYLIFRNIQSINNQYHVFWHIQLYFL